MPRLASLLCALLASTPALAQDKPPEVKLDFAKPEEVKQVVWKANAQLGFLLSYGTANAYSISGGFNLSRHDGKNRLILEGAGAFGQTLLPDDKPSPVVYQNPMDKNDPKNGTVIDERPNGTIDNDAELNGGAYATTVANFLGKLRYDRFFTTNNTLYISAIGGIDQPAGKQAIVAGQVGYMRQLLKNARHDVTVEAGLDYTFLYLPSSAPDDKIHIGSARFFLGYALTINDSASFTLSGETFINFNKVKLGGHDHSFGQASRAIGKAAITTKLAKWLAFRFALMGKYENAPAFRPAPSGFKFGPGYTPLAQPFDLTADASLVITFL